MAGQLMTLRNALIEKTEAGQQVKVLQDRVQAVLTAAARMRAPASNCSTCWSMLGAGRRRRAGGSHRGHGAGRALDYQFLLTLSDRLEKTTDAAQRKTLEDLRALITELQAQQRESAQAMMGQAQEVLQAVLEATDTEEALRQYADAIDETFLALLAGNIERAEQTKATAAVRRLREIYDMALDIVQEGMPPEMRLINDLLNAADKGAIRKLLEENRGLLSRSSSKPSSNLEDDFRQRQGDDVADRLKSIRAQAALML
jgi:hypothetical protein